MCLDKYHSHIYGATAATPGEGLSELSTPSEKSTVARLKEQRAAKHVRMLNDSGT